MARGDGASPRKQSTGERSESRGRRRPKVSADSPVEPVLRGDVPRLLARSLVFCRVPFEERARLDRAILLPAEGSGSLEKIAKKFKLAEKYGISPAVLRTYARKLERLMRPTMTSQIMAGVLGCLPKAYRRKLMDGSEVMLVSRLLNALQSDKNGLSTAELARLGSLLSGLARRASRPGRPNRETKPTIDRPAEDAPAMQPTRLAESVRLVYGLSLPLPTDAPSPPGDPPVGTEAPVAHPAQPEPAGTPAPLTQD